MKVGDSRAAQRLPQPGLQQLLKEVMVAKPRLPAVQLHQRQAGLNERRQQLIHGRHARDGRQERPVEPLQDRGLQQEGALFRREIGQDLCGHVFGQPAVPALGGGQEFVEVAFISRCRG